MPIHVTALFRDHLSARVAVDQLTQAGFARDDVSVLMSRDTHERDRSSLVTAPAGASGVFGAIVADLSSLGALAGPASGLLAVGPLVAAIAGIEGDRLAERVREGGILVAVYADAERVKLARQLLDLTGGVALEAA